MQSGSALVADRMVAALAARTWSFGEAGPDGGGRLFLLARGCGALARGGEADAEVAAPALLWLPREMRGRLRVGAGGEGWTASVGATLLQRTANDPMLAACRLPFLSRSVVLSGDKLGARLPALSMSFQALAEESRALEPGAAAAIGLHLGLLILELWRGAGSQEAGRAGGSTVQRFMRLIELHYREAVSIGDYARKLGVSQAHLHDSCCRLADRTPLALVHERLLEEARARLEQTEMTVEQIGYSLGFRDPGYFNRFFKRLSGQSPGAFRRGAGARRRPATDSFAAWP